MATIEVPIYLQIEPVMRGKAVAAARMLRATNRPPGYPLGGVVLIALRLRIPSEAFLPLQADPIDVPLSLVEPIEVEPEEIAHDND